MQVAWILQIFRIFVGHGSYCLPGLHAWEAASHVICVVAPGNSTIKCTEMYIKLENQIFYYSTRLNVLKTETGLVVATLSHKLQSYKNRTESQREQKTENN